jgi:asparagine synthase (glutamine-hydrolysing)
MANSLELRVPFLDKKVAEITQKIPEMFKYKGGKTKWILREALKGTLPKETAERKKLGFPTALKHWLKAKPELFLSTITENEYIKSHCNVGYIKHLFKEHSSGKIDNSRKIYILYMLALWYNIYMDPENTRP